MKVYLILLPPSLLILIVLHLELTNYTLPNLTLSLQSAPPHAVPPQPNIPPQPWVQDNILTSLSLRNKPWPTTNLWDLTSYDCKKNSYYFPSLNIVFSGVPKAGCSNWLGALMIAEGSLAPKDFNRISNLKPNLIELIHGYTEPYRLFNKEVDELESLRSVPSFTIVRNPWVRMVSGYRDKLSSEVTQGQGMRRNGRELVAWARGISVEEVQVKKLYPTFGEFVDLMLWKRMGLNQHFAPQFKSLGLPRVTYDYIAALELLDYQQEEITTMFKLNISVFGAYDKSSDPRVQQSVLLAKEWLTEVESEKIERLYELFKPDFLLYNYSNFSHPDFPLPIYHQD